MQVDHLVIAARTLDEGCDWLAKRLGVAPDPGGRHDFMGTYNQLLSLGPEVYLEVIAIDPDAASPPGPRWFGLDRFNGSPRLITWVARGRDIAALPGTTIRDAARGALRWRITIPDDGSMPADGITPLRIEWQGGAHPCQSLPDHGLRLRRLSLSHPTAEPLPICDPRIALRAGAPHISAVIQTTSGQEVIL